MSGAILNWAARADTPDITAKCVLVLLAEAADDRGETWVSQGTLAKRCGVRRETVCKAMGRLEAAGLISRQRRSRDDGSRSSDCIRLNAQRCDANAQAEVRESGGQCAPNRTAEPLPNPKKDIHTSSRPEGRGAYPEDFEATWQAYPHFRGRSDKIRALKAWQGLSGPDRAGLTAAVAAFAATPEARKDNGQYVKGFDRWIAAEAWRDFVPNAAEDGPNWEFRLKAFRERGWWRADWGPKPGEAGYLSQDRQHQP